MSKSQSIKIVSNLGGAKMATYNNVAFNGYGDITTDGDYVAHFIEIRDWWTAEVIATETISQGITFDTGILGACTNQLVTLGRIVTAGLPSDCSQYDFFSTWQI